MYKKKLITVLSSTTMLLSLYSTPVTTHASKINTLEEQYQELENESSNLKKNINQAEEEMNALDSERQELTNEITNLQSSIDDLVSQIQEQENEIARLEKEIEKLQKEIKELQEKIDKRNEVLADQARGVQTVASPESIIDMVLSAESVTDLFGKIEVINLLVNNNYSIMEEQIKDQNTVKENKLKVDAAKDESDQVKAEMEANHGVLLSQRKELDNKVQVVTEKFNLTNKERKDLLNKRTEIASRSNSISNEIKSEKDRIAKEQARIAAEKKAKAKAEEAAKLEVSTSTSGSGSKPSNLNQNLSSGSGSGSSTGNSNNSGSSNTGNTSKPNSGGWIRPASGRVSSEYGMRIHPITGQRKLHGGIDIAGGGSIVAAKEGRVITAGYHSSWGNYVRIDHGGGIISLYAHMQPGLNVSAGQTVSQGQRLGTMGTTGSSTGVHLHFEIYQNGSRVNPRNYVSF